MSGRDRKRAALRRAGDSATAWAANAIYKLKKSGRDTEKTEKIAIGILDGLEGAGEKVLNAIDYVDRTADKAAMAMEVWATNAANEIEEGMVKAKAETALTLQTAKDAVTELFCPEKKEKSHGAPPGVLREYLVEEPEDVPDLSRVYRNCVEDVREFSAPRDETDPAPRPDLDWHRWSVPDLPPLDPKKLDFMTPHRETIRAIEQRQGYTSAHIWGKRGGFNFMVNAGSF